VPPDSPRHDRRASAYALAAIGLWASLARVTVRLSAVPPLLLIGLALSIGALCTAPRLRRWRVPPATLLLGVYGLFGYHFCLFLALRYAPPVEANLLNYLWPLLLVLLSPLVVPGVRLASRHVIAGLLGFSGCALIVLGHDRWTTSPRHAAGYALAILAAFMWSTYSLLTKRVAAFPTAAVGGFSALSGALALGAHLLLEPRYAPTAAEWGFTALLGLGPMGAAFLLWDAALKRGDPRAIGTLAYLTPALSTGLLAVSGGEPLGGRALAALALILGGAWLGNRRA